MFELSASAVAIGAAAAFLISGIWYATVNAEPADGAGGAIEVPAKWLVPAESARSLVVAFVVVALAGGVGADGIAEGALIGIVLFAGFPVVLFAGSMLHERYPARLAALHLGDWLLKLIAIGAIAGAVA
jgi:hypothetical protein